MFRSKNLKDGFMALSITSLIYTGSSMFEQCKETHVSANLSAATFSSFFCLASGRAFVQFKVLRLLSF